MNFYQQITQREFSLVVSLPSNDLNLAAAAIAGGAQAIKVHLNVWHRASGHSFGSFTENKKFLSELVKLCKNIPVGVVPGGEEHFISNEERLQMEALGIDFFSSYIKHLPCFMMGSKVLSKMGAIDSTYNSMTLSAVKQSPLDIVECSIQPGDNYGKKLVYDDILRYSHIAQQTEKPTLIPTQKAIQPEEVKYLHQVYCKAIMIGAIVVGENPTPEQLKTTVSKYREAIEAL